MAIAIAIAIARVKCVYVCVCCVCIYLYLLYVFYVLWCGDLVLEKCICCCLWLKHITFFIRMVFVFLFHGFHYNICLFVCFFSSDFMKQLLFPMYLA